MILTTTEATPIKNSTEFPLMVQNSMIVAASAPTPRTSTGSLPYHITYFWTSIETPVYYPDRPTIFSSKDTLLTPILLPCTDTKEVPSPQTK